jgi:hypothetical protein
MLYRFLLIAALIWSSSVLSAQEPRDFGDSDKVAIAQMYDRYSQAFVTKDYAKLREYVQAPFVLFLGELRIFESVDAVTAFYRGLRESLDQRGFDHGEIGEKRIVAFTADRALLNTHYRRYRRDGSLLEEQAVAYLVSKSSGTWKLCGLTTQDLKYFGKVY